MPDTSHLIESAAREQLSLVLISEVAAEAIDLDADMVAAYGLTSLNKVLFLTEVCEETDVDLAHFTEHDLAAMRTLRDVTDALTRHHATTGV
ncbi:MULTISPECIES: acyl carrier protein [unclassified Streptomyces]|uniref:acyl carrier protein n=1 Tax=unclassified Streptomyces TaxID=2593676 RepID=UPI001BEA7755|nr:MULTISPECIES: acyl carrier protein [unclassified Streptomyces]MBT2402867.1 acyl carrier protein [Streptomyces sp. ISL-21]MBT2454877.1 acyl carrier protein [Streptomyces sp. ISL-86]MBT2612027.1 acyl carrier protein [Streptomyces sp. ISL-87]